MAQESVGNRFRLLLPAAVAARARSCGAAARSGPTVRSAPKVVSGSSVHLAGHVWVGTQAPTPSCAQTGSAGPREPQPLTNRNKKTLRVDPQMHVAVPGAAGRWLRSSGKAPGQGGPGEGRFGNLCAELETSYWRTFLGSPSWKHPGPWDLTPEPGALPCEASRLGCGGSSLTTWLRNSPGRRLGPVCSP